MRISSIPLIFIAMAGVLALSGCEGRPFTEKAPPAADIVSTAPEALAQLAQGAACCACPPVAAPACPEVAPTQVAAGPAAAPPRAPARQTGAGAPRRSEQAPAYRPPHAQPAAYHPPPQPVAALPLIYGSHGAHGGYAPPPADYAHAGGGGPGPCCAGPPVQAAGRDSAGYLTWSGKRPPAPYY